MIRGYENQLKCYVLLTLAHEVFEMSGSCLYQILCCPYVPCECCTVAPSHKDHLRIQQDATHWKRKYILVSMDYCVTVHNMSQESECSILLDCLSCSSPWLLGTLRTLQHLLNLLSQCACMAAITTWEWPCRFPQNFIFENHTKNYRAILIFI